MNTTVFKNALGVATLIADALVHPQLAQQITQQPATVATVRGLDMPAITTSARVLEQGQQSVKLGVWY